MSIIPKLIHAFLEGQVKNSTLDDLGQKISASGESITARLKQAANTPANRAQAAHVIGIERWGAHRLASAPCKATPLEDAAKKGAAPKDEYDGYRPSADLPMPALADEFHKARLETLALLKSLQDCGDQQVPHNQFGAISVKAWLSYLNRHASLEARKIR